MYENPLGSDACAGSTPARGTNQTQESRPNGRLSVYQHKIQLTTNCRQLENQHQSI